jgi:hypothetical protein
MENASVMTTYLEPGLVVTELPTAVITTIPRLSERLLICYGGVTEVVGL